MNRRIACVLLQLLLFSSSRSVPTQAQGTESAKAFVQRVYADYANPDWRHQEERLKKFYTRSLLRLIAADKTGHLGEVGNLDWDPICSCQDAGDPGDLKVQSITLSPPGPFRLKAVVAFTITGGPNTVTLSLLKTPSGWRIDDISERETPSLRAYLKNDHR
jgi:Protein of unknown function (DUF3828)